MPGQLFTHYFLTDGIKATDEWKNSVSHPETFAAFSTAISDLFEKFVRFKNPNESVTEQDMIRPVLELLGWMDYLPQQGAARNEDIPDHLLFANAESKTHAAAERNASDRFRYATVVEESKRFGLSLDSRDKTDKVQVNSPHGQILRYLSTADIESESQIRWGILTNGGVWRLYDYRARPRASGYYEADLTALIKSDSEDELRIFYLLFRRDAFTLQQGATTTFLETALTEGRQYEEKVAKDLSSIVFKLVFPDLVSALADATTENLSQIREAALIFLYRLLFVLYAEDRGLLPVNDSRYDDYGLRKIRNEIANRTEQKDTFSARVSNYYDSLVNLFRIIDEGDPSIGLPPYNGGLFASQAAPMLEKVRLPDSKIAPIIYSLSHVQDPHGTHRFVNYRDMSAQQLGSIYERLLEHEPMREDGEITIRLNPYARKDSGSFYTLQELVDLIVDRTLKPLAEERLKAFEDKAAALKSIRRPKDERKAELQKLDPAEAVLNLKVLDPAMGSGHFLVTAVDFLSDYIAELIEYVPTVPDWLNGDYVSPLVKRVETIRSEIIRRAKESDWVLDETQLTDQAIIRRMVLKRCIYGVDKNPLTVELAKVSLWLHSFTVGAPLSFLDHHLRCGDSLIGLSVSDALRDLRELGGGLFAGSAVAGAEKATDSMQLIEEKSDADIAEAQESALLFHGVEDTTADLRGLLDFLCGYRYLTAGMKKRELAIFEGPLITTLGRYIEDAYKLLSRGPEHLGDAPPDSDTTTWSQFTNLWHDARAIADREGFLHWEVAFPGVWHHWTNIRPQGGFDAIIGNPPWDRIKLQEVEWFAPRASELALAPTAAARRAGIQRLRDQGAPLVTEFDAAKARADSLSQMVRTSGHYPLLGTGDINLYSLFIERAMNLIKPDGFIGLLTPSGIYADKTAARFFKSVSTSGRLGSLFDFENRRPETNLLPFFPDVDSRFKFCALIFGGEERLFDQTECAFFLHDTKTINDEDRCFPLTPDDFARVNPNTGTAPVFRSRLDAEIIRGIYERHPVLADHSGDKEPYAWSVKYSTMFHMANASHHFRTEAQLDAEGFYPVQGNRWKRGDELYLPLYQGRMIHQFDHRANSVKYNPDNTINPYLSVTVTADEHANPSFSPMTQYWILEEEVSSNMPDNLAWTIAYRRIARPTDVRTMIVAAVPKVGLSDSIFILMPEEDFSATDACMVIANLNSHCFDYVTRQKMPGTNLSWYILEQLPVIAPTDYDRQFGNKTARDLVRDHVLRLTYTAHDMAPFARDLGYDAPPFIWDEEERRHLRARLDALYFHLYGLSRKDAEYVLSTFPIVRKEDEATFGKYRTRDLILAYMNALAAGDPETVVAV